MQRIEVFEAELKKIITPGFQDLARKALNAVDVGFFVDAAAYHPGRHPEDEMVRGEGWTEPIESIVTAGGLVIHTKKVVAMAPDVMRRYGENPQPAAVDALIVACLLHDCCKRGLPGSWGDKTLPYHGELAAMFIYELTKDSVDERIRAQYDLMLEGIAFHMGRWGTMSNMFGMSGTGFAPMVQEADYYGSLPGVGVRV